jgi:hypothetical protein
MQSLILVAVFTMADDGLPPPRALALANPPVAMPAIAAGAVGCGQGAGVGVGEREQGALLGRWRERRAARREALLAAFENRPRPLQAATHFVVNVFHRRGCRE